MKDFVIKILGIIEPINKENLTVDFSIHQSSTVISFFNTCVILKFILEKGKKEFKLHYSNKLIYIEGEEEIYEDDLEGAYKILHFLNENVTLFSDIMDCLD